MGVSLRSEGWGQRCAAKLSGQDGARWDGAAADGLAPSGPPRMQHAWVGSLLVAGFTIRLNPQCCRRAVTAQAHRSRDQRLDRRFINEWIGACAKNENVIPKQTIVCVSVTL